MSYVRLSFTPQFFAGLHTPQGILINRYHVDVQMITLSRDMHDQNVAVERMKYVVYEEFCSSILINQNQIKAKELYEAAGLRVIAFPADPVDHIIGLSLFHKLSSVAEDAVQVLDVNLISDIGNVTYMHNEDEESALGDISGWWNNPDPSCVIPGVDSKVVTINAPTWKRLDLEWYADTYINEELDDEYEDDDDYEDDDEFEVAFEGEIIMQPIDTTKNVVEFKPNDNK